MCGVGGGIFAKTAKTPPLQSALRGWHCAQISPISPPSPCAYHAPRMPPTYGDLRFFTTTRHGKGGHSGLGGQLSARPYSTSPTKSAMANLAIDRNGMPFYHDAARRVATFFEKWNFLIETYLHERRGKNPDKRLPSTGLSPRFPFWNTAV